MTAPWLPQGDQPHELIILGDPRSEKVMGPDGKERLQAEMLVGVGDEVRVWRFGISVFKQLQEIRKDHDLDNVILGVRRDTHGQFPRIEVFVYGNRKDL